MLRSSTMCSPKDFWRHAAGVPWPKMFSAVFRRADTAGKDGTWPVTSLHLTQLLNPKTHPLQDTKPQLYYSKKIAVRRETSKAVRTRPGMNENQI